MKKIAFLFAGQGSQSVGMMADLYESEPMVRAVFDEACEVLGRDVRALCFDGPQEELNRTENTQVCLLTAETALARLLREKGIRPSQLLGFSLGEYAAVVDAGVLSFPEALKLVEQRACLMQSAVPEGAGAMAAVVGQMPETVEALCAEIGEGVWPANYNAPLQTVVSGRAEAVAALRAKAKERKVRTVPLAVSVPSHCPLMQPAADGLEKAMAALHFADAALPVVTNVDAEQTLAAGAFREKLTKQLTHPVRFCESICRMKAEGVEVFLELGPGHTLSALVSKICGEDAPVILNVGDAQTLADTLTALKEGA